MAEPVSLLFFSFLGVATFHRPLSRNRSSRMAAFPFLSPSLTKLSKFDIPSPPPSLYSPLELQLVFVLLEAIPLGDGRVFSILWFVVSLPFLWSRNALYPLFLLPHFFSRNLSHEHALTTVNSPPSLLPPATARNSSFGLSPKRSSVPLNS